MSPRPADYRRWLVQDAGRLRAAAAAAPAEAVPTCPGWVGRDLVDHVGEVFAHKVATLRLGRRPNEGERPWAPDDDTVFGWYDERLAELLAELDARDPDDRAWTFIASDQTVRFWWRRMAHETAIHRVDAELAAGLALSPHDEAQAADGVAELLQFSGDTSVVGEPEAATGSGGTLLVAAGGSSLLVTLTDDEQVVAEATADSPSDALIQGEAADVYRSLWNRPADGPVTRSGDPLVLQRIDARLALGMR